MKTTPPPDGQLIALTIDKLVHGGSGLAKHEGKAVFIDGVLPGEVVRAVLVEQRSQFCRAELREILAPSPARTEPACSSARHCGGCQWQHMTYEMQLAGKAAIVLDCLNRIGKLHGVAIEPPIASPGHTQYRSRADFKISPGISPEIGFYQRQSHLVIPCSECLLLEPALLKALQLCRTYLEQNPAECSGFTDLQLLAAGDEPVVLGQWQYRTHRKNKNFVIDLSTGALTARRQAVYEQIAGLRFIRNLDNFYQVNRLQNAAMIEMVCALMCPLGKGSVLDLFCGCGNFSLFLARNGCRVTGIDSNAAAIAEARENARLNGIDSVQFSACDVDLLGGSDIAPHYDGILINPPRSGCAPRTLELLAGKNPSIIVYVSCNPATLARDLNLLRHHGYRIDLAQPFDMFPQTYHIETIVKLTRQPDGP